MDVRHDKEKVNYIFYNPDDTKDLLFKVISTKKFNQKTPQEKKIDWWYESQFDFEKNIALIFGKFIPHTLNAQEEADNKNKWLQLVIKEFETFKNKTDFFKYLKERRHRLCKYLEDTGWKVKKFHALCPWRLVIGLGTAHTQETSMTLHHIYGIPYIPGSAIKGITRHWAILRFAEKTIGKEDSLGKGLEFTAKSLEEGRDLSIEVDGIQFVDLIEIFGTQKKAGKVVFMDAYPLNNAKLGIDIINVHYPEYYSKDNPPADWQKPVPVKFLTVQETKFEFCVLGKDETLIDKAINLLNKALSYHGIGAKTSLGYGLFKEVKL
ncbi:MAG: type III-B CRISPR module RAMP protein Cmr6 [candidate division WOR-3 bacterium]